MDKPFVSYPFSAQRFEARVPALQGGTDVQRHAVVIVGGGPVGMATALGLAKQGVASVVLEADDSVCFGSRAICVARRSLEILNRLGVARGFMQTGLPWTGGRSFYRGQEVLRFAMPQDDNQQFPPMLNMAQYSIEQHLLDGLAEHADLIDVRWQSHVRGLTVTEDGAHVVVSTPQCDYALDADWLVACDGGRSFVRESMGLKLEGTSYEGRYVIVDILMASERQAERLAYFDPPCNPGSTVLVHKQPGNVWRIDYQLRDGEDPDEAILPENVMPRVASLLEMMGETAEWNPIWTGIYKANALTLARYRHGRVMFAGDAAHLVPIFGVRGFNSGIDDADNLSWKLAGVVRGFAHETLLDSYSLERVAATRENLSYGTKSTEFMAPPSFAFELMRHAVLSLAAAHPGLSSLINPRQSAPIAYTDSPLNGADLGFDDGPQPGTVLPEAPLTRVARAHSSAQGTGAQPSAGHLTDLLTCDFTVMVLSQNGEVAAEWSERIAAHNRAGWAVQLVVIAAECPLEGVGAGVTSLAWDHTGQVMRLLGACAGSVYVIRPDGHVLARAQAAGVGWALAQIIRTLGVAAAEPADHPISATRA